MSLLNTVNTIRESEGLSCIDSNTSVTPQMIAKIQIPKSAVIQQNNIPPPETKTIQRQPNMRQQTAPAPQQRLFEPIQLEFLSQQRQPIPQQQQPIQQHNQVIKKTGNNYDYTAEEMRRVTAKIEDFIEKIKERVRDREMDKLKQKNLEAKNQYMQNHKHLIECFENLKTPQYRMNKDLLKKIVVLANEGISLLEQKEQLEHQQKTLAQKGE